MSARRVALQMIHNTIVCAPDGLRDQLRSLTRMQLVRTLASWRPDLTACRDLDSAYRIGLKSLARRYLELHDEIADLDVMITPPLSTSWRRTLWPAIRSATSEPPSFSLRPATIPKDCGRRPASRRCAASALFRFRRPRERPSGIASTEAEIAQPTARCSYHRHRTPTDRPENQGLCYSSDSRRAFQTRRHSSLEALPRPRGLHAHHSASQGDQRYTNRRLTNRRASSEKAGINRRRSERSACRFSYGRYERLRGNASGGHDSHSCRRLRESRWRLRQRTRCRW